MNERFKIEAEQNNTFVKLDDSILFYNVGYSNWYYVYTNENGVDTNRFIPRIEEKYFPFFLDDIMDQIENGVDRNELIINIPKKVETIKIGNKYITIEI
jgi:hypothetical protein